MRILVAGSSGNFGKLASDLFSRRGHEVTGIGRKEQDSVDLSEFDICVLSIPVLEMGRYIEKAQGCTIVEVSSVKNPLKKYQGKIISIHPMFGPRSFSDPDFQNIIYVDDLSAMGGKKIIETLFPGFNLVNMTADDHDRAMVEMLIKPFLMSRIASEISRETLSFSGPSQKALQNLSSIWASERPEMMEQTIRLNPYSAGAVKEIMDAITRIGKELV